LKLFGSLTLSGVLVAGVLALTLVARKPAEQPVVTPVPPTNINIRVTSEVEPLRIENAYRLRVTADIPYGVHIYSIYQEGGAPATLLRLNPNLRISVLGEWGENPKPVVVKPDWSNVEMKVLTDRVVWSVDFKMIDWNGPTPPAINGTLLMYPCTDNMCYMPQEVQFTTGD